MNNFAEVVINGEEITGVQAGLIEVLIIFIFVVVPLYFIFKFLRFGIRVGNKIANRNYKEAVDQQMESAVLEFAPPDDISPAEAGVLFDNKGNQVEILATLYDLKNRGFLNFSGTKDSLDTIMVVDYDQTKLMPYEDLLMRYYFNQYAQIAIDEISNDPDYLIVEPYFQFLVQQSLQNKGYLFFGDGYTNMSYSEYLTNANLIAEMFEYLMHGVSKKLTVKGKAVKNRLFGFRKYIETAEKDKIKFHTERSVEGFLEAMTPYAIVFNQLDKWVKLGIPKIRVIKPSRKQQPTDKSNIFEEFSKKITEIDNMEVADH